MGGERERERERERESERESEKALESKRKISKSGYDNVETNTVSVRKRGREREMVDIEI